MKPRRAFVLSTAGPLPLQPTLHGDDQPAPCAHLDTGAIPKVSEWRDVNSESPQVNWLKAVLKPRAFQTLGRPSGILALREASGVRCFTAALLARRPRSLRRCIARRWFGGNVPL